MAAGDGGLTSSARVKTHAPCTKRYTAGGKYDSIGRVTPAIDPVPDDIEALRAALLHERAALAAEQLARREAEARASDAEAMVAHLKLLIAQLKHDRFGASSERGRKLLDQLELQLEELEAACAEDASRARRDGRLVRTRRGCLLALAPSAASQCAGRCRRTSV